MVNWHKVAASIGHIPKPASGSGLRFQGTWSLFCARWDRNTWSHTFLSLPAMSQQDAGELQEISINCFKSSCLYGVFLPPSVLIRQCRSLIYSRCSAHKQPSVIPLFPLFHRAFSTVASTAPWMPSTPCPAPGWSKHRNSGAICSKQDGDVSRLNATETKSWRKILVAFWNSLLGFLKLPEHLDSSTPWRNIILA